MNMDVNVKQRLNVKQRPQPTRMVCRRADFSRPWRAEARPTQGTHVSCFGVSLLNMGVSRTRQGPRERRARPAPARSRSRRSGCRCCALAGSRTPRPACRRLLGERCAVRQQVEARMAASPPVKSAPRPFCGLTICFFFQRVGRWFKHISVVRYGVKGLFELFLRIFCNWRLGPVAFLLMVNLARAVFAGFAGT